MLQNNDQDRISLSDILFFSNLLSLSRILILPFAIYSLSLGKAGFWYSFGLCFYAILSDIFDGMLSRSLDQESRLGRILDPIADKLATLVFGVGLVIYSIFPVWYFIILIARDIMIILGVWWIYRLKKIIPKPTILGKIHTVSVGIFILLCILDNNLPFSIVFIWKFFLFLVLALTVFSSFSYGNTFLKVILKKAKTL